MYGTVQMQDKKNVKGDFFTDRHTTHLIRLGIQMTVLWKSVGFGKIPYSTHLGSFSRWISFPDPCSIKMSIEARAFWLYSIMIKCQHSTIWDYYTFFFYVLLFISLTLTDMPRKKIFVLQTQVQSYVKTYIIHIMDSFWRDFFPFSFLSFFLFLFPFFFALKLSEEYYLFGRVVTKKGIGLKVLFVH